MSQCVYTCHPTLQPVQIGLSPEGCRALLRAPARSENPSPDTAVCHISISSGLGISSLHCPSSPGADISPAPPAGAVPPLSWPDCLHFWAGECGKRMGKAGSKCSCEWHLHACLRTGDQNLICWVGSGSWSSPIFLMVSNDTVVGRSNPAQPFCICDASCP